MVSTASLAAMVFTLLVAILFPIVLLIVLYVRKRISLLSAAVGALVFLVFQLLTRIPLLNVLSTQPWYQQMAGNVILIGLFLSLTAGLFEEIGRYLAFRFVLRNRRQIKNGVAYGVGHGGFEAIVLVGLTYVNNLVYSMLINSGQYDALIGSVLGDVGQTVRDQLVNTPAYVFALAGVERVFAIVAHIALSLVVLLGVRRGRFVYVIYAILLHTLLNFPLVYLSQFEQGVLYSEMYLLVFALGSFLFIRHVWRRHEVPEPVEADVLEPEA